MKPLLFFLCFLAFFANSAGAREIIIPSDPSHKQIPKRNYLGEKVNGIRLYATFVLRLADGETLVMKGFIAGKPNGDSNYFYWNDKLNVECSGKTHLQKDKSGAGLFVCTRDGATFLEGEFVVVREKYMKFKATTTTEFRDENGGVIWAILRWHSRTRFPDPQPLLNAFK